MSENSKGKDTTNSRPKSSTARAKETSSTPSQDIRLHMNTSITSVANTNKKTQEPPKSSDRAPKQLPHLGSSIEAFPIESTIATGANSQVSLKSTDTDQDKDVQRPDEEIDDGQVPTTSGSVQPTHNVSTTTTQEDAKEYINRLHSKSIPKDKRRKPQGFDEARNTLQNGMPLAIPPQDVVKEMILPWELTPFHSEEDLPTLIMGTPASNNYRVLSEITAKLYRIKGKQILIADSIDKGESPKGIKLNRNTNLIQPTTHARLEILAAIADTETKIIDLTLNHYDEIVPVLEQDFNDVWGDMNKVSPEETKLLILKLVHDKNVMYNKHIDELEANNQPKNYNKGPEKNPDPSEEEDTTNQPSRPQRQKPAKGMRRRNTKK